MAHYPNAKLSDGVMFIWKDIYTDLVMHGSPQLGWPFYEGDNFHPQENIEKMARGEPLTDQVSPGVCIHVFMCVFYFTRQLQKL